MEKICLFIILFLLQEFGLAQETFSDKFKYKATYQLTHQPDSTDQESVESESMVLYLGDRISSFSSLGTVVGDSLMENRDRSNKSMGALARLRAQIPETKFSYYLYKGVPEGKLSYTRKIAKDNFRYVEELDQFDWEIQPETKEIAGYRAQKATTEFAGRKYIAWFTSEIPIPDGPYKFNGLPGLILEIQDQKDHYSFRLTDFQALRDPVSVEVNTKDYITTTQEKYLRALAEYNGDPFAAMERVGITIGFKPGQKEKMLKEHREKIKKRNNTIELN